MKILIVKTSALGDIIHAFPVVDYLKSLFPQVQIDWIVEKAGAELVKTCPGVNHAYIVNTKAWRKGQELEGLRNFVNALRQTTYDVVFDLQGNLKSGLMTAVAKSRNKVGFAKQTVPEWPNLIFTTKRFNPPPSKNIREDYLFLAQSYFNNFRNVEKPRMQAENKPQQIAVMVCPGSNWPNKQLSREALEGFLALIQQNYRVMYHFVWGNDAEKEWAKTLHARFKQDSIVVDRQPLPMLKKHMEQMQLVIAMDSLPLHMAGTTSALTFSVFGPSSAHKYNPLGKEHHALQGTCPYGRQFEKRCPILRTCPTGQCIKGLTSESLWKSFKPWFEQYYVART